MHNFACQDNEGKEENWRRRIRTGGKECEEEMEEKKVRRIK
jgi:hypothetical protein